MVIKTILEKYLVSNEQVIEEFSPVKYQGSSYKCAVTNFRVLLYTIGGRKFTEIEHRHIASSSLERKKIGAYLGGGIASIIGSFFMLWLGAPTAMILLIILGINLIILYAILRRNFVQIRGAGDIFNLYSKADLLNKLITTMRDLRHRKTGAGERPTIDINIQQEEGDQKFCIHCGAPIRVIAIFCDKCGKKQE